MGRLKLVGPTHLSPSGTSTLMSCERQYVAKYGAEKMYEPGTLATATGGGLALALEVGSVEAGLSEYYLRRPDVDPILDDPDVIRREDAIATSSIRHAYARYITSFPGEEVERELTYLVDLWNGEYVPSTGAPAARSRRLLQVRVDGVNWKAGHLVEDKLRSATSLKPDVVENEVRQGRQLTAEIYGHWKSFGKILPISYRLLRKPDPRKLREIGADLDALDAFIGDWFRNNERALDVRTVTRTEGQLREWEAEQRAMMVRADELLAGRVPPVRNTSACHAFGRTCPLLAQCQGMAA